MPINFFSKHKTLFQLQGFITEQLFLINTSAIVARRELASSVKLRNASERVADANWSKYHRLSFGERKFQLR